jgi:glycosyltransferase involved in cell wall biosynthesis
MRIGIDVRTTQLDQGLRGIGKYVYDLVEGLSRMAPENEYLLIAFPDRPLPHRLQSLPASCRIAPLPTRRLEGLAWRRRLPYAWKRCYASYCRRENRRGLERAAHRETLDVLHLPCVVEPAFFSDGNFPCRVVKTIHDLIPLVLPDEHLRKWSAADRHVYQAQVASFRRADVVVAISRSTRDDTIKYLGLPPEKIRVVPNAVSEEFTPITDAARLKATFEKYGIWHPYFLFCSGDGYTKNRERVIEAFVQFAQRHPEPFQMVFVGPRGWSQSAQLAHMAQDRGLNHSQFLVTGFVPDADLVTLYAGAAALVAPSLYEGFGLPPAQAMRAGTPVIASDRSSQPEVVGDAGILVDPQSVDAIAEAMLCLARDPALRAELSARGRERVRRFRWQNQARAMLEIYSGKG